MPQIIHSQEDIKMQLKEWRKIIIVLSILLIVLRIQSYIISKLEESNASLSKRLNEAYYLEHYLARAVGVPSQHEIAGENYHIC